MVEPIKPKEAREARVLSLPDEVVEAFNELVTENLSHGYSSFKTKDVVTRILGKMQDRITRDEVYENGWLSDVPRVFRRSGWKVFHDVPGYNETYEAQFEFTEKGNTED